MQEPTGQTIDGRPWEEARPPHVPDRLASINPWIVPFLAVAAFQVWLLWVDQPRGTDDSSVFDYWFVARSEFVGIAGSLIGLALFLRHPDARSTLPQLARGGFLLLLAQVLGLIESTLDPVFVTLAPPSDDLSFFSPLKQAYSIFTAFVGVFGIAFIASGLSAARRREVVGLMRGLATMLAMIAVASAGLSMLGLTTVEFEVSPAVVATIIASLLVNLFGTLAVAYLFVVSITGWLAREEPRSGWRLASVAAGLMLLIGLLTPFIGVVPMSQEAILAVVGFVTNGTLLGWVLLVIAFALGLPSTESKPEEVIAPVTGDPLAATQPGSGAG